MTTRPLALDAPPALGQGGGPRVLIVDDDESLAKVFRRALEAADFVVQWAPDGADAKRALESESFDVVVSDISMPGMSGIELLQAIRQRDLDVPVILVTGAPDLNTAMLAVDHGALRYLEKPVTPQVLRQEVARAARLHELARVKRRGLSLFRDRAREASDRAGLEAALTDVLDSLWMSFQPIAQLSPRTVFAYEALLRSSNATLPGPPSVLGAAERLGRMHDLGRAVRRRVAEAIPRVSQNVLVFVNVHPLELGDDELLSESCPLTKHAPRVVLEVTERAHLDQVPDLAHRIGRLRALGYRLAVDDLGAGYAGLTTFVQLNPEFAKIDMSLIRDLHRSEPKQALVRSILELCRGMGIRVVAEGVETGDELRELARLEADLLQGYLMGRPGKDFAPIAPGAWDSLAAKSSEVRAGRTYLSAVQGAIRILHLEDEDNDAELVAAALASDRVGCDITRVTNEADFRAALKGGGFDLILADYSLPTFDGATALVIAREQVPHVPFIILSGTLGEELAIETLKNGATDYVLKDRLARLGPSVGRALREAAREREKRDAEASLKDNQKRLDFALRASRMGVWSWEAEEDAFRGDERMSELLSANGRPPSSIRGFLSRVHDEDRDRVESEILAAREQGAEFHVEYRVATGDGSGRHVATRGQFLLDTVTQRDRAIGVSWDITNVKLEEQQRRLLSTVLESATNAVMIADADGRISWVNSAFTELTGYGLDEVRGENPRFLKSGKHDENFYRVMWDTLSRGVPWQGQIVNRRKDGTLYTEEMVICPVRGAYGETTSFVCMKRDITLEVDLTRQLHQAQRLEAVGRLAGGIAHDFNNILTVISGNADLALADLAPQDPMTQAFHEIADASRRAASLTRQLLAFSRKQILQPRVLVLNELITATEKMLRRLIGEDVKVKTRLQPELGSVLADPGQLEQILMNLAVNARDAMPRGGEILFETENVEIHETQAGFGGVRMHSGNYVKLTVSDTGEGMDEETQARIFEPFFTTKEKGKGTGLGLATVYGIVKQSGGYIWATSEPGKGTAFQIYFPQVEETPERAERDAPLAASQGGETILVVEDEEVVLKLARSILERNGYQVLTARNGADALRTVEEHGNFLHLLLTDVVMPGMSGRALADAAQSLRQGLRVLFTSGYTDDAIVHHGVLDAGAHLLEKPYSRKSLLAAVRKAIDGN